MATPSGTQGGILMFGGSFHPIHLVHLKMAFDVGRYLNLREVLFVPSYQTPGKPEVFGLSPVQRFHMIQEEVTAFQDKHAPPPFLTVSQIELTQKKPVFTIDTIKQLKTIEPNVHLLIGLDQFESFASWKHPEKILERAAVSVVNRPNAKLPDPMVFCHTESSQVDLYLWAHTFEVRFFKDPYDERNSTDIRSLLEQNAFDHPWLNSYLPSSLALLKQVFGHHES